MPDFLFDWIFRWTHTAATATCHGLDSRSIHIAGHALPYCARCTGLLWALLTTTVFLRLAKRTDAAKPPNIVQAVLCGLLWIPLAFDGASSYLGLRGTTNEIRFITGVCFSAMLPAYATLLRNYNPEAPGGKPLFRHTWEMLALLAANGLFYGLAAIPSVWMWGALSLTLCALMFAMWYSLFATLYTRALRWRGLWGARVLPAASASIWLFFLSFLPNFFSI